MILRLYQDRLERVIRPDGYRDGNGDYHEGSPIFCDETECDAVPAGAANVITYEDGTKAKYSYVVYLSRFCPYTFEFGESVRLTKNGVSKVFEVKGFQKYQLQSKLYI